MRVSDVPTAVAVPNVGGAMATNAEDDRHKREQSAESEADEKDGFHEGSLGWLVYSWSVGVSTECTDCIGI